MKNILTFILTFLFSSASFAQISLFKDINTLEAGSNPANFVEANGLTFFTVQKYDGYYLWKTDGTEAGTMAVSDQKLIVNRFSPLKIGLPTLYLNNDEVYYQVSNSATNFVELWKTNGITNSLVLNSFYADQFISYNNELFFLSNNNLYKIYNNDALLIKNSTYLFTKDKVGILNGEMIFYAKSGTSNGDTTFQLWKSDGTITGTVLIKSFDNIIDIYQSLYNYENKTILADGQVYFFLHKLRRDLMSGNVYWDTELWKSNGTEVGTIFVKKILIQNHYNTSELPKNLTKFNNKVIFNEGTRLWISDGTENGTQVLKTFQSIGYNQYSDFLWNLKR